MKFGRLVYRYTGKTFVDNTAIYNIGDNIQTFAIDYLYECAGIDKKDIININASEMKNYSGEYVLCPIFGYASHYKRFNQLPPSDKIIPIYIGFDMSDPTCDDIISSLIKYEPIGCRDEATMELLRSKGVKAYITGCVTTVLPKRNDKLKNGKVFLVDIPHELKEYIPKEYLKNAVEVSHEHELGHSQMTEQDRVTIENDAKEILKRYKEEASLVITSRLHAASPCVAMGIPTIVAINNIDRRFSFIDKLIPIYDSNHFDKIDWNPRPVEMEGIKKQIISLFCDRLKKHMQSTMILFL